MTMRAAQGAPVALGGVAPPDVGRVPNTLSCKRVWTREARGTVGG